MTTIQTPQPALRKPLRLWPAVALATLQFLSWLILPRIFPDQGMYWFFGTILVALVIVAWWLFFSRAPWSERLGAIVLMAAALFLTSRFLHISVLGLGQGMMFPFYATPIVIFAFAVAVIATHRFSDPARRAILVATILLASGPWTLLRIGGISMTSGSDFAWRWSPTPEEQLLAQTAEQPAPAAPASAPAAAPAPEPVKQPPASEVREKRIEPLPPAPAAAIPPPEWPGFRGANRDSVVPGLRVATDWSTSPPLELWRRPIGPGWSSFAVQGDYLYTQEQRGEEEIVACYNLKTGEPVWMHRDATRFWEANAGPGPRGTPTLSAGRVYSFGATGFLNALDAATGAVIWSRNVATDAEAKVPYWGFASSPLVLDDLVVVAASDKLVAYDLATGNPRWQGPKHRGSYSSPHLLTIEGEPQILLLTGDGATSLSPADGKPLWEHAWAPGGATMLQPARAENGDLLLTANGMGGGEGVRRVSLARSDAGWTIQERWTSRGLKPYFNDFVVHNGHAYGFDGSILSCIDLADGARKWKGGRYGNGQMLLLPDQNLLLVLSEEGELALVSATPDQFKEIARAPALEGKTWNHPALVGDILLVRNDREMAAFRLTPAK
jgi:outer membrane protein assembly factor BamB